MPFQKFYILLSLKDDMKKSNLKSIPLYLLSGLIGGTISYGIFKNNLENKISNLYEAEAKKFRVDVNIEGIDSTFNFSDHKKFISDNEDDYYSNKEGFAYFYENTEEKESENSPYKDIFGQKYTYSITGDNRSPQKLRITYYDGTQTNSVSIDLSEEDEIMNIYMSDNQNNTNVWIRKDFFRGNFKYENVDKEGAKKLYNHFQTEFLKFKKEHELEKLIKNYEPRFELKKKNMDKNLN